MKSAKCDLDCKSRLQAAYQHVVPFRFRSMHKLCLPRDALADCMFVAFKLLYNLWIGRYLSDTDSLLLISLDPLSIHSGDVFTLWVIKYTLGEHIFLNAPKARILENALGKDTSRFPTEVLFSSIFHQCSSNGALSVIKALRVGDTIRVCIQLGCFNNISLGLHASYCYSHVQFKRRHEKCT